MWPIRFGRKKSDVNICSLVVCSLVVRTNHVSNWDNKINESGQSFQVVDLAVLWFELTF